MTIQIYPYLFQVVSFVTKHRQKQTFMCSDLLWFRSTSVLLLLSRLVYVTGKVEKQGQNTLLVNSIDPFPLFQVSARWVPCLFYTLEFLCFLLCLLNGVDIVLGSCAADFRKLTSLLFIHVRSCSCIPFT